MLATGIEIVGLFAYCQNANEKVQSIKKLNSIMTRLFTKDPEDDSIK